MRLNKTIFMKALLLGVSFLLAQFAISQTMTGDPTLSIDEERASMEEYESNHIYIQLELGFTLGSTAISNPNNDMLLQFSELKEMLLSGEIISISQSFQYIIIRRALTSTKIRIVLG